MEIIATIDLNDYEGLTKIDLRHACRAIIIKDNKLIMVHSNKGEYKFPGGGINENESLIDALIREVKEETGLYVIKESIKEFGTILEKRKSSLFEDTIFMHYSYYFTCNVYDRISEQSLDEYEKEEEFTLSYVTPKEILDLNKTSTIKHTLRENKALELIIEKGLL